MKTRYVPYIALAFFLLASLAPLPAFAQGREIANLATDQATYAPGSLVTISGTVVEAGAPVSGASVALEVSGPGGRTVLPASVVTTDETGKFSLSFKLPLDAKDGTYTVYASTSGAALAQTSFTVVSDMEPPTITSVEFETDAMALELTSEVAVSGGKELVVKAKVEDNVGVASVEANGVALSLVSGDAKSGVWEGNVTAPSDEGEYTVEVTAVDFAGNEAEPMTSGYTVDNTPPTLDVSAPVTGIVTYASTLEVKGEVNSDAVAVILAVNDEVIGMAEIKPDLTFSASVPLALGDNTIEVWALDAALNENVYTAKVTRMELPLAPLDVKVKVESPAVAGSETTIYALVTAGGSKIDADSLTGKVYTPDKKTVELSFTKLDDGVYTATFSVPEKTGVYYVVVEASAFGRSATADEIFSVETATLSTLSSDVSDLSKKVDDLNSTLNKGIASLDASLKKTTSDVNEALSQMSSKLDGAISDMSSAVDKALGTMKTALSSIEAGVGQVSVLLIVAVVLAAISAILAAVTMVRVPKRS